MHLSIILMKFDEKLALEGELGVPSHQNYIEERPSRQEKEPKRSQDSPKDVKRDPQMDPRGGRRRQICAPGSIAAGKYYQN